MATARRIVLTLLAFSLVLLSGCTAPAPTPDTRATEQALAAIVQGTMTALAPTATDTPAATDTPVATDTPAATDTPPPSPTPPPTDTPLPSATPEPSQTPAPTKVKPTATPANRIFARKLGHSYQMWGRPHGMDYPGEGCGPFDNLRPLTALIVNLVVENRGDSDMVEWYADFYAADQELFTCYYIYSGESPFPTIPAGKSAEISFITFTEDAYAEIHGYVWDEDLGQSNTLTFPHD